MVESSSDYSRVIVELSTIYRRIIVLVCSVSVEMESFRVSLQGTPVWLPAALRRSQKNHTPGILEHATYALCNYLLLLAWWPKHPACVASPISPKTKNLHLLERVSGPLCQSFNTFSLLCPLSVPVALRRSPSKHAAELLEHASSGFQQF